MNAVPSAPRPQLDLAFARRGARTVLDRRLFRWPFVVTRTFALDAVPAHLLTVILQTGAGAVHGEDSLAQAFDVGPGAAAHCTTQGASPVHRAAPGAAARDAVRIRVAPGGHFEHWPQPRILFPGAALDQTIDADCAPGAAALIGDAFTIHDPEARGRGFTRLRSTTTLRRGGEVLALDRLDIGELWRGRAARFRAFGTVTLLRPDAGETAGLVDALSAALARNPACYGAASLLPAGAGLGVRLAAEELRQVRAGMDLVWTAVRHALYGSAPTLRLGERDSGAPPGRP